MGQNLHTLQHELDIGQLGVQLGGIIACIAHGRPSFLGTGAQRQLSPGPIQRGPENPSTLLYRAGAVLSSVSVKGFPAKGRTNAGQCVPAFAVWLWRWMFPGSFPGRQEFCGGDLQDRGDVEQQVQGEGTVDIGGLDGAHVQAADPHKIGQFLLG